MVEMVIVVILAVGLVLVSVVAVGAMLWMRYREQKHDMALRNTEVFAQLDHALNHALKEIDKKNQALLTLYSKLGDPKKSPVSLPIEMDETAISTVIPIASPTKRGRGRPRKTPVVVNTQTEPLTEATALIHDTTPASNKTTKQAPKPKPIPRKPKNNAKHQKVLDLRAQDMAISDIAKKLSIGQAEVTLILEKTETQTS